MPLFHFLEDKSPRPAALLCGGVLSLLTLLSFPALINHFSNSQPPYVPFLEGQPPSPIRQDGASATSPTGDRELKLSAAERQLVVRAVNANLKEHYVDPAVAQKVEETLLAHEKAGDYESMEDGTAFAALLTRQVREVSHDMHLDTTVRSLLE
jgi:hypothetical protein